MYNINVLEKLERGEITVNKAITMIKHPPKPRSLPKGNILMVRIRNENRGLTIPIPLFFINFAFLLGKFGLMIVGKVSNNHDMKEVSEIIKYIDYRNMRKLVYSLRMCKSTGLVEVRDKDSMVVINVA